MKKKKRVFYIKEFAVSRQQRRCFGRWMLKFNKPVRFQKTNIGSWWPGWLAPDLTVPTKNERAVPDSFATRWSNNEPNGIENATHNTFVR
jgi:hypothetical protein